MKTSRLVAIIVTAIVLICACFAAEAISKADLIACLMGEPVDVICPEN